MVGKIEQLLITTLEQKHCLFVVLLDPDAGNPETIIKTGLMAAKAGADALLIGGSFIGSPHFSSLCGELAKQTQIPVILFPGDASQIANGPDAILFTTLLSGRNPQYLIVEQARGAFLVKAHGLEPIPTAYLLIESGKTTAVEFISNTRPIPANKPIIASAHSLAAEMMGMRWVYLEAGSGAQDPVPADMVAHVKKSCDLKVIVGGGMRTPESTLPRVQAGADVIVIGTAFESDPGLMRAFGEAIHS